MSEVATPMPAPGARDAQPPAAPPLTMAAGAAIEAPPIQVAPPSARPQPPRTVRSRRESDRRPIWRGVAALAAGLVRGALWQDVAALAVLAATTIVFFWPAIAHGQLAYENDTRIFYFPLFATLGEALRKGVMPLWSSDVFTGYPVFADGESGSLYPVHLLALLLFSTKTAFLWLRPVRFFQAGVFTYLFCRTIKVGRFGALVGALSFAFCGFAIAQLHHTNISTSSVWLPLALAFAELSLRGVGRTRYAYALLAGIAFGVQGLIVHVQVVLMSGALFAAYCGYRAVTGPIGHGAGPFSVSTIWLRRHFHWTVRLLSESLGRLLLATGVVGVAGITGAGIAAVQLLPLYELGTFSFRGDGVTYAFATQYSLPPIQLVSLVFPDFFTLDGRYWGLWSRWEVFAYAGIAPLLLAVVGMLLSRRRLAGFFTLVAVFSLVVAMGEYSPFGVHRFLASLPGFSVLRAPGRFVFLFNLGVAMLAAFGADALRVLQRPASRKTNELPLMLRRTALGLTLLIVQLLVMAAPVAIALASAYVETHKDVSVAWLQQTFLRMRGYDSRWTVESLYQFLLASLDVTRPATLRQLALLLGTSSVLLLWVYVPLLRRVWQALLLGLIAVDLVLVGQSFHPTIGYVALAAPSGAASAILSTPGLFRVYTRKATPDEPNRLLSFHIAEANGYSSLEPDRHQQYTALAEYAPNRLLDLMNARFYAVPNRYQGLPSFNLTSYDPRRPLLSSTGRNPAGTGSFQLAGISAESLRIVSTLRWAATLPQGTPVARITATETSGKQHVFQLRAGLETAEWAWDRPDLKGAVPHQLPTVAYTWQQQDGAAPPFPGHFYYGEFPLGGEVTLQQLQVQFVHPTAQVEIFGISAFDDATKALEQLDQSRFDKYRRVYADTDVILYENQDYLPRAFLVPSAVVERPGDEILMRMGQGDFSPERFVILEEQFDVSRLAPPAPASDSVPPIQFDRATGTTATSGPGSARIATYSPDGATIVVDAKQNAMLFLGDQMYPGWRAYLDGAPVPIYRADYLFRSVFVPVGHHTIEFRYEPRSFRLGLLLTLLTTLLAIAGLLVLGLGGLRWRYPRGGATMAFSGTTPPAAEVVNADGATQERKGAQRDGRQESEEHHQEEQPEEGSLHG